MDERLDRPTPFASTKLIIGLFFAFLGVLWTGENLRLFDAEQYLQYWPAFIVLIGLLKLSQPGRRVLGAIVTAVGASLLAYNAGWVRFTIFDLWPLILIALGVGIVARALGVQLPGVTAVTGRTIWAILTARKIDETSRDYTGNSIVAFMGQCELDLTKAEIAHGPAIIDLLAFWGAVEIYVPDRWEVIGEVIPFMGGFEVKTGPVNNAEHRLIVRGAAVMGGVEIKRRKV
jgi:hypothetical protein